MKMQIYAVHSTYITQLWDLLGLGATIGGYGQGMILELRRAPSGEYFVSAENIGPNQGGFIPRSDLVFLKNLLSLRILICLSNSNLSSRTLVTILLQFWEVDG